MRLNMFYFEDSNFTMTGKFVWTRAFSRSQGYIYFFKNYGIIYGSFYGSINAARHSPQSSTSVYSKLLIFMYLYET